MASEPKVTNHLVAPGAPTGNFLPGKQLCPWYVPAETDNPLPCLIGLAGMFPPGRDDQAGHACADTPGLSACCQQADFGVGMRPVAPSEEIAGVPGSALNPGERGGLVGKTPRLNDGQGIGQMGMHGPQKQEAVRGGNASDWQGADVPGRHGGVGRASFAAA